MNAALSPAAVETLIAAFSLRRADSAGRRWHGPCPRCGGSERATKFTFEPERGDHGRFHCFSCDFGGSPEYVYAVAHLGDERRIRAAREELGLGAGASFPRGGISARHQEPPFTPSNALRPEQTPPPPEWQRRKKAGMRIWAENILGGPSAACAAALEKPRAEGGRAIPLAAAKEFARAGLLGWNDDDRYGMRGLVCAAWRGGELVSVRVRTADGWRALSGGLNVPLAVNVAPDRPVVVVESYIDALFGVAHLGAACGFIGLGSVSVRPSDQLAEIIRRCPRILVCVDADKAGDGRWPWWREHFENAGRVRPVDGAKGFGDMPPHVATKIMRTALELPLARLRSWRRRICPSQPEAPASAASVKERELRERKPDTDAAVRLPRLLRLADTLDARGAGPKADIIRALRENFGATLARSGRPRDFFLAAVRDADKEDLLGALDAVEELADACRDRPEGRWRGMRFGDIFAAGARISW